MEQLSRNGRLWKRDVSFDRAPYREPQALSKGGLSRYVYWTRLLSFNRIQSKVITGLHTVRNSLRYIYIRGLIDSPLYRRCGAEEETSAHVLCEYDTQTYLFGFLFLGP